MLPLTEDWDSWAPEDGDGDGDGDGGGDGGGDGEEYYPEDGPSHSQQQHQAPACEQPGFVVSAPVSPVPHQTETRRAAVSRWQPDSQLMGGPFSQHMDLLVHYFYCPDPVPGADIAVLTDALADVLSTD